MRLRPDESPEAGRQGFAPSIRALEGGHVGVPVAVLRALRASLGPTDGLTIDYRQTSVLGHPLVVLRPLRASSGSASLRALTRRQLEVAALVAEGLANKVIARRLAITEGTVKDHVHRLLMCTGAHNRTALAGQLGPWLSDAKARAGEAPPIGR